MLDALTIVFRLTLVAANTNDIWMWI